MLGNCKINVMRPLLLKMKLPFNCRFRTIDDITTSFTPNISQFLPMLIDHLTNIHIAHITVSYVMRSDV